MNTRNTLLILLIVLAAVAAWSGSNVLLAQGAGAAASGGVAVVDTVQIFNQYQQIVDLNAMLKARNDQLREETEAKKKVIEQKGQELSAFAPDSPDFLARQKELLRMRVDLDAFVRVKQFELQRTHVHWTRTTYNQILDTVEALATQRNLSLVLYKDEIDANANEMKALLQQIRARKVLYSADTIDLTSQVLEKLNADYKLRGGKNKLTLD